MEDLSLRFGMEVCLRSQLTSQYLGYNEKTETTNANSVPPYIQIYRLESDAERKLPSLKFRVESRDQAQKNSIIVYGSRIFLIDSETGFYMTTIPTKESIGFDRPGLHEGMNNMLEKSGTFVVLDPDNAKSRQPISVYDEVHFKSVIGKFIICQANGQVSISGESPKHETAWNIMKADTPYIPAWVYQRPTFCKFLQPAAEPLAPSRDRKQLGSLPVNVQEMSLIEDILDVMLGFDGEYIKKNSGQGYSLEPQKERPTCIMPLAQLTQKILVLPSNYYVIENYIAKYGLQQGTICQALCSGLRELVKEYKMMAISFDEEVGKRGLTLQEIWYYIQPSLRLMDSVVQLIKEAQNKKGGQLISVIIKMLNGTTSEQVVKTYTYLFQKCLQVYIQMVSKWIYEGLVGDKYQEFMIMEEDRAKDHKWTYWEDKFLLRRDQVPSLFERDEHIILVTGKYLNIIRLCSGESIHPLHKEIQKNMQKSIKNQDFTESIMRAYDWANERLQNLVMKEFKLLDVLKSMKGYYFLGFGDLFLHFMDSAEEDLNSSNSRHNMDLKKLQNLFELLVRTSSANNDPYKDEVSCQLESGTIYEQIHKIKTLEPDNFPSERPYIKKDPKNVDYFNLKFNCVFPLNLIVNKNNLSKYQILFRYLFWCKFLERQLNGVWMTLQSTKIVSVLSLKKANMLTQKMLNFIKSIIYYISYEVIEKNWLFLEQNLAKVHNFEDIISFHNEFLNRCLKESLLIDGKMLPLIINDLGSCCQGFLSIRKYAEIFSGHTIVSIPDPKDTILAQRIKRRNDIVKNFEEWHEQSSFEEFMFGYNDSFDKNLKKLLREIYSLIGNEEGNSYLIGLLDTLDPKKFYNRLLFQESKGLGL